jgi:DNA helicase II / ATP-dependent DNA helicase PcrA
MLKEAFLKPEAILAGAGTGKTHTIVEKLKTLIAEKVCKPEKIVCITFSNEACESISRRVRSSLPLEDGVKPIIRTFHGFSGDLLRLYGDKIGISKDFKILDPDRAKIVLHSTLKVPVYYCHKYVAAIHHARDLGITLEDMERHLINLIGSQDVADLEKKRDALQFGFQTAYMQTQEKGEKKGVLKELEELNELIEFRKFVQNWKTYEKIKKKQNYQDYSDLSANALLLLNNFPEIAKDFEYIIVDEFQDTNKVQLDLIFALAPKGNVTVVGDLNQSIYRFRGAYKENFAEFKKYYKLEQSDIRNLSKSHRSTNKILRAAHKLIEHNYQNKEDCFEVHSAYNHEGENINVFELKNSCEEARKVGEIVEQLQKEGLTLDDICIMVRTHQQSQLIKKVLEMKNIAYCSLDKPSLLKQKYVKLVVDYLTLANTLKHNSTGGEHCWWDIFYQSDFSADDMIILGGLIKDKKKEALLSPILMKEIPNLPFSESGKMKAAFIIERIKGIIEKSELPVTDLIFHIYTLLGVYSENNETKQETVLELNSFMEFAKDYSEFVATDLRSFIYHLGVLNSLDISVDTEHLEQTGVKIMTTHATKGLEYKAVIVTNLAQKRFPMMRITQNKLLPVHLHPEMRRLDGDALIERLALWHDYEQEHQLHEERRLFYVACTRAKEKLFLTYSLEYGGKKHGPSQFLEELDFLKNPDFTFTVDQDEHYPLLAAGFENQHISDKETKLPEKELSFSPSALLLFDDCQKKYQYKYIYNMPDDEIVDWTSIKLGSFVHLVLETGVRERYTTEKQFIDYAHIIHEKPEWNTVELSDALQMVRVFYQRNKDKYNRHSRIEQYISTEVEGVRLLGFADRIDIHEDGSIEIIDYKTSRSPVSPKHRSWQLGLYALAAQKYGKVRALTLDMLRLEKPLTFVVDDEGNATSPLSSRMEGFNIFDVKEELLSCARRLTQAYKNGFKACAVDKHCEFCNEYVYKL